jgi:hypothetical protein
MKRLILLASLCVAAIIVAPVASASAAGLKGHCTVKGTAKFPGLNLTRELMKGQSYEFTGTANCEELPGGEKVEATVTVSGKGELSCAASVSKVAEGLGTLTLTSGPKKGTAYMFNLGFTPLVPGVILLQVEAEGAGKVTATGYASFLKDPKAEECFTNAAGVSELKFEALAAGEI